ncbi:MAG: hypothetical protein ACODAB_08760, partial [Gemmatimonadota bacterium]
MNIVRRTSERAISLLEAAFVRAARLRNRHPPLFVVGVPRSGTTALYLHLANQFRFAYIPNVAKRHPYACVAATAAARLRHRYRPTYDHAYGAVDGPLAPSDGWDVFLRWFPRYDHDALVAKDRLHELRTLVRLFEALFRAPEVARDVVDRL